MKPNCCFVFFCLLLSNLAHAGDPLTSSFSKINNDIVISSVVPQAVITQTFTLTEAKKVLVVADGRYFPYTSNGIAQTNIQIDNDNSFSNNSIINWKTSTNAVQHTFDCIASATLSAGTHTIRLVASIHSSTPYTNFKIGSGTGLSILVDPAPNMVSSKLTGDSGTISYATYPTPGTAPVPVTTILTNQVNVGDIKTSVVTLSSGRSYKDCNEGDALWGLFLNDELCTNNGNALWSVNDIFKGAELQAPMFQHAFHNVTGNNTISLKAGELSFNYFENAVCYKIGADTRLISLYGMGLSGRATLSTTYCNREEWACFGTTVGTAGCPAVGTLHEVASAVVDIPNGHNGVMLFLAKVRLQPDKDDVGGNAFLSLNIDGVDVGTLGVQEFKHPNGDSSRTISASYLSAGANRLAVGSHTVKVFLKANGSYKSISYSKDIPLIYFD